MLEGEVIINDHHPDPVERIAEALRDPNIHTITLHGKFDFGGPQRPPQPPTPRRTITITRGVKIQGDPEVGTEIVGGGADGQCIAGWGTAALGPFNVRNFGPTPPPGEEPGSDKPVIFENIRFREWKGEAISIEACQGIEVRRCTFTHPAPTTLVNPTLPGADFTFHYLMNSYPLRFVHAILALGAYCKGKFIAEENQCKLLKYAKGERRDVITLEWEEFREPLAHDENFLACVTTNFDLIKIRGNDVTTHDDGIEVILNGKEKIADQVVGSAIHIHKNTITLKKIGKWDTDEDRAGSRSWSGHAGIVCCANHDEKIDITDNLITVEGGGSIDGDMPNSSAICLTSPCLPTVPPQMKEFTVRNNLLHLQNDPDAADPTLWMSYPACGIMLGLNDQPKRFPGDLHRALYYADVSANWITGKALFGIMVPDALPAVANDSNNNWLIDNDFGAFEPSRPWPEASRLFFGGFANNNMYRPNYPEDWVIKLNPLNGTDISDSFLLSRRGDVILVD